jgi:O-antigen/teichoic acid export membrane protein
MKHWFRDTHFRSLMKNVSYLAASRVVASLSGIATLAFAGHGLGLAMFGTLILITSYTQAASGLSKFQSWQLIIRYGSPALLTDDPRAFKQATGFAFALDVVSGLIGMVLAMALLPLLGPWFGIPQKYMWLAMIYCLLLPTMAAATPIGVLRALDRFDLISWQSTTYPIVRASMALVAWWQGLSFPWFVAIWFVTDLGGDIYLWFLTWRELRRRKLLKGIRPTLQPTMLAGAWKFAVTVNLTSSLNQAWGPIARLIVGGLLGPASAGLYRVAASMSDATQRPADLLNKAYFPEVMRMDLATKHPWKLMLRSIALATGFGLIAILIVLLFGKLILGSLFGPDFVPAYKVLLVILGVPLLNMMSFPLPSMLYALDRPDAPLNARLIATIAYFVIVVPLTLRFDTVGAAAALVIGNAVLIGALAFYLRREYHRVRAR